MDSETTFFIPSVITINANQMESENDKEKSLLDLINELTASIVNKYKCRMDHLYKLSDSVSEDGLHQISVTFVLSGKSFSVMKAKTELLNRNISHNRDSIKTRRSLLLNSKGEMRLGMKEKLDEIMKDTQTLITCVDIQDKTLANNASVTTPKGLEIQGPASYLKEAKIRSLVLLDVMMGLSLEQIPIESTLSALIAGRCFKPLKKFIQVSGTNVYIQSNHTSPFHKSLDTIYITGKKKNVQSTVTKLEVMIQQKKSAIKLQQVKCTRTKIDWICKYKSKEIHKIKRENAVHIDFEISGEEEGFISISGEFTIYVQRAIRLLMDLMVDLSMAQIQLKNPLAKLISSGSTLMKYPENSNIKFLYKAASESESMLSIQKNNIEIWGTRKSIKLAYAKLIQAEWIKSNVKQVKFQIELGETHREFINGKKNGKINKIISTSGCNLVLHAPYNDYNFLIELQLNASSLSSLQGFQMLEDELPAELSFFVPEPFHKRIIGVAGKNIQKIMKQYGVFVKFSNTAEFTELGGYQETNHNVIARTPAKNAFNLKELENCIMESIKDDELPNLQDTFKLSRELHRIVNTFYSAVLRETESRNNAELEFPDKEDGSEDILIRAGTHINIQSVQKDLECIVPNIKDFDIPPSPQLINLANEKSFQNIIQLLENDLFVSIEIYKPAATSLNKKDDFKFTIIYRNQDLDHFERAKEAIINYLKESNIQLEMRGPEAQVGSYANLDTLPALTIDPFGHFDSKLIGPPFGKLQIPQKKIAIDLLNDAKDRRLEGILQLSKSAAHSMPDLRHIFDSPPQVVDKKEANVKMKKSESELAHSTQYDSYNNHYAPYSPQERRAFNEIWASSNQSKSADFLFHLPETEYKGIPNFAMEPPTHTLTQTLSRQEFLGDDDVLQRYLPNEVIDQLVMLHNAAPYSLDQTYLFLDSLNLTYLLEIFMNARISFFKLVKLTETDLRNMGITPLRIREIILNAAQQCLSIYEFTAPFPTSSEPTAFKGKPNALRFFPPKPDNISPLSDPINKNPSHPSP